MTNPKVAVITGFINPKNEELIYTCIDALNKQTYDNFEIYIYNNSTIADSLSDIRRDFPQVKIKNNNKNLGFAGGNNSVIRELLKGSIYKYIVLLNDDTKVDPNWLTNLVESAEINPKLGAVTSKLLFYEPFIRIEFLTQTSLNNDKIAYGIDLLEDTGLIQSKYKKRFYREGFYGFDHEIDGIKSSKTKDKFVIDFPIGELNLNEYNLRLDIRSNNSSSNQKLKIKIVSDSLKEKDQDQEIELKDDQKIYDIKLEGKIVNENYFNLIQNAGSAITAQFNGYDIGNVQKTGEVSSDAEIDHGQYDKNREVEMFCGCAVLLRADTLREVGIFDEYYFAYYEDSDLSLRIRKKGWKIYYEPSALVRHIHTGSSGEQSLLFRFHVHKNKPAFVLKNFNIRPNIYAFKELMSDNIKALKNALIHNFRNNYFNSILKVQIKSNLFFFINIPSLLLKRFGIIKSN